MNAWRQVGFWVAAFALLILFLVVFSGILLPFVAGMALAYALDPVADRFERLGLGRLAATLTILVLFIVVLAVVLVLVVPILANQLADFIAGIPGYVERLQNLFSSLLDSRLMRFLNVDSTAFRNSLGGLVTEGTGWLASVIASIWSGGWAVLNIFSLFVVTPVVAFYLLNDWDRLIALIDTWLPRDYVDDIRAIARDIDQVIGAFVRGQGLVCLVLGIFYSASLAVVGLNFGLLIGFGAGLLTFIPFVGATVGFVASVGVALVQFPPDWAPVAATAAIFVVGQLLEGYVLQPRLIGQSVHLHPVWVMFALFAFGVLFGFVGVLIAIPAAAAIGVLVRYGLKRYIGSPFYRGSSGAKPAKK